jgi:hypothetical protein
VEFILVSISEHLAYENMSIAHKQGTDYETDLRSEVEEIKSLKRRLDLLNLQREKGCPILKRHLEERAADRTQEMTHLREHQKVTETHMDQWDDSHADDVDAAGAMAPAGVDMGSIKFPKIILKFRLKLGDESRDSEFRILIQV